MPLRCVGEEGYGKKENFASPWRCPAENCSCIQALFVSVIIPHTGGTHSDNDNNVNSYVAVNFKFILICFL